jgi:hypothetical protein
MHDDEREIDAALVRRLLAAAREFFDRYNREPSRILSVIDSHAQNVI